MAKKISQSKIPHSTDALHPARLFLPTATEFVSSTKKFLPKIANTPALPAIKWSAIGQQAPQLLTTPTGELPVVDAVVITWAEPEWAALQQVFCSSGSPMNYTRRNTGSWPGWIQYANDIPAATDWKYWGYYRLVQIGSAKVLLFKSNTHYASADGEAHLEQLVGRIVQYAKPSLILSIGTAGGARISDPIGTVNVVHSGALYESGQPSGSWPDYTNPWPASWTLFGKSGFNKLLFPIPTTAADLKSICAQFNKFYGTTYALDVLNVDNLNTGAALPAINNMTPPGTALVTANSFVVGNSSGNLSGFACVEMDDAIIAKVCAAAHTPFGFVRNISDPIQNSTLPAHFQGHWGEAIYTAYGLYSSFNGAITAWAILTGQFASQKTSITGIGSAAHAVSAATTTSHVRLNGSRRYKRSGSIILGRSDRQEWCDVVVKVRRKANLPEPNPDQPIRRSVLLSEYGANPADLDLVASELTPFGLVVTSKDLPSRSVKIGGPVSAMETAFGVRLFQVSHKGLTYRGRVGEIHIPSNLNGIVTGVFGLDSRPMIKRGRRLVSQTSGGTAPPASSRLWFFPTELADAYQFPAADGTGQVIGILEFGGHVDTNDFQQFWLLDGNKKSAPTVTAKNVESLTPSQANDPDGTGETMLDIEVAASVCPKAAINVYFSEFSEKGWVANLDAALHDKTAPTVVSISYSYPEGDDPWTQGAVDQINDTLKEFANAGITVCVSSGDDGSDDAVGDGMAHVGFPATSPYVLAVGGTSLNRHTGAETVWHEGNGVRPPNGTGGATGGGVSTLNPRPAWQASIGISSVNPHAPAGRIIPDVSGNAALNTGYRMYGPTGQPNPPDAWMTVGGTSASTPLWAALIARLQQLGKQIGFLTPRLYAPTPKTGGKTLGTFGCRDITQGSNASGDAEGYSASAGYDAATGWGSPNGANLLKAL